MYRNKFHGIWARFEPGEGRMLQSLQHELSELLDAPVLHHSASSSLLIQHPCPQMRNRRQILASYASQLLTENYLRYITWS